MRLNHDRVHIQEQFRTRSGFTNISYYKLLIAADTMQCAVPSNLIAAGPTYVIAS